MYMSANDQKGITLKYVALYIHYLQTLELEITGIPLNFSSNLNEKVFQAFLGTDSSIVLETRLNICFNCAPQPPAPIQSCLIKVAKRKKSKRTA